MLRPLNLIILKFFSDEALRVGMLTLIYLTDKLSFKDNITGSENMMDIDMGLIYRNSQIEILFYFQVMTNICYKIITLLT